MKTSMYDDVKMGPDAEQLKVISALAQQQLSLERQLAEAEAEVKSITAALRQVQEVDLPDAMAAAGCKAFTLASGEGITVKDGISASLSAEKRGAACAWLREHGFGDLVTDEIAVTFGRGQEEQAKAFASEVVAEGLMPRVTTTVNTATLKSLIREQLEQGREMPLDLLGAYQWKKAVIK